MSWGRWRRKSLRAFLCQAFILFSFSNNTTLFISAITPQTDSSWTQLSSPIASISRGNLISSKERKPRTRGGKKPSYHVRLCVFAIAIVCVCVCFPSFFSVVPLFLSFFPRERKPSKERLCGTGWSGLLVSGCGEGGQHNTTNMAGSNQGPGLM